MLKLDGSQGEGGGQILRSALALAMVTGTEVRLENIRARRKQPGLMRQHLTAVNAAAEVCGARLKGASLHSSQLDFAPGPVKPGTYRFDIGSAGSCTLVLQTVLPALMQAGGPSQLEFIGGTHNPLAPPFEFVAHTFLPLLARMGVHTSAALKRHGFYPRGGGRIEVTIDPAARLEPLTLLERGDVLERRATAIVAGLPRHIAERELAVLVNELGWSATECEVRELAREAGPGNVLLAEVKCQHVTEVFVGFGEKGVPAEAVAQQVAAQVQGYLASSAPVCEHLADQLLLPLALAGGGEFATGKLSQHTSTNINVIAAFLSTAIDVEPRGDTTVVHFRQKA